MDQKTIGWVSYLTIIGWIIALVSYNGSTDKSNTARFHLRQSFGLHAIMIGVYFLAFFLLFGMGRLGLLINLLYLGLFILWILGFIAALNGEEKQTPLLGDFFQKTFTFIK